MKSPTVDPKFYEMLTPQNAALLLIDHQSGIMQGVHDFKPVELKNNVIALASLGKIFNLPTIITASYAQGPNGPIIPEIINMYPDLEVIHRTVINSWGYAPFVAAVEKTGRRKLIMAGVTTDVCLAFPAISAAQAGYDVYAVYDASGSWDVMSQQCAINRMIQAGVKVVNWVAVAAELQKDWTLPTGPQLARLFADHLTFYSMLIASHQAAANAHKKNN